MRFEEPLALLLLLLLPLVVVLPRARLRTAPPGQLRAATLLRCAIVALLVLAVARPVIGLTTHLLAVVFVLDVSASMSAGQQAWARDWVRQAVQGLEETDRWSVVEFGARPRLAAADLTPATDVPADATDLEAALRLADTLLPAGGPREIVLLTDGWDTLGFDATAGQPDDGPLVSHVLPSVADLAPEVAVQGLDVQPAVRVGEVLDVTATLGSTLATRAQLRLLVDGQAVTERSVALEPGGTRVSLPVRVRGTGFHALRVELVPEADTRGENNVLDAATVAADAGRVLLLEDTPGEGAEVQRALVAEGVQVQTRAVASIPPSPDSLAEFDSIVLVDTPANHLTLDQQRTLQAFVRNLGGGLVVVGGPRSFAPGGYEGTVLDEMLPVSATPPPQRKQGSVALYLVVDKSGSMDQYQADTSKMALAREAAIQATELLLPEDTLGVIAFDDTFQWVLPPAPLRGEEDIRQAQARIAAIHADGGTTIAPALEAALDAATRAEARLKHIVLLTDGQSNESDYPGLAQRIHAAGITLSTVAIGSDANTKLLEELALLGEGVAYATEGRGNIPRIATTDSAMVAGDPLVEGQVAAMVWQHSPLLRGLSGELPALSGYVATTPRERAVTALGTRRGHPLLAHWQYGVGRVVAWTSDAGAWTSQWRDWPEAGRFWSQAVHWSMPGPQRPELQVTAQVDGTRVTLQAQSLDERGDYRNLQDTRATVVTPRGDALEVPLPQRGPGTYALTTQVSDAGAYRVVFAQHDGTRVLREELAAFAIPSVPELRSVGLNHPLLGALAQRSGGRQLKEPTELRQGPGVTRGERTLQLWPWLLGIALLLLPVDVAVRRLYWLWFRRVP